MVSESDTRRSEEVARYKEEKAIKEERVAKMKMKKANEKILERRKERLMRIRKKKKKKNCKSKDSESFTSSEDEDDEEVKRLMEKGIRESISLTEIEPDKMDDDDSETDYEKMYPRSKGRLIRYLKRLRERSKVDVEATNSYSCSVATNISDELEHNGSDQLDLTWISWFISLPGNDFLCEVEDDFILDDFNLCGLDDQVPYYEDALDLILDEECGEMITEEQYELIESAAEMLYGLIHARYILTFQGQLAMLNKFNDYDFGRCPRLYCSGQACLPIAISDIPRASPVKLYCPKCEDVYDAPLGNIDGAYFGTTFPHLFLMTYVSRKPVKASQCCVPRVFGFKFSGESRN